MSNWLTRDPELRRTLVRLGLEVGIYAVAVTVYVYVVFAFFTPVLVQYAKTDLALYAALGLALMVLQGFVLESFTTWLVERLDI